MILQHWNCRHELNRAVKTYGIHVKQTKVFGTYIKTILLSCKYDETNTILEGPFLIKVGSNNRLSSACPKWLEPMCVSKPSSVLPWGHIMTPALHTSMLTGSCRDVTRSTNSLTLLRLQRSSFSTTSSPTPDTDLVSCSICSFAALALSVFRHAKIIRAPKTNKEEC